MAGFRRGARLQSLNERPLPIHFGHSFTHGPRRRAHSFHKLFPRFGFSLFVNQFSHKAPNKKSRGVKSGDGGGHCTGPLFRSIFRGIRCSKIRLLVAINGVGPNRAATTCPSANSTALLPSKLEAALPESCSNSRPSGFHR